MAGIPATGNLEALEWRNRLRSNALHHSLQIIADDPLDLRELMEPKHAVFATIARLFIAPKGGCTVPRGAVEADRTAPKSPGDSPGFLGIALDVGGETVRRVIGD